MYNFIMCSLFCTIFGFWNYKIRAPHCSMFKNSTLFKLRISKSQNHDAGQWVHVPNSFKFEVYAIFDSLFGVLDSSRGQGPEGSALYLVSNPNLLNTTSPKIVNKNRKKINVFRLKKWKISKWKKRIRVNFL